MSAMASQITSLTIVYPTVYSGADQRKHQSSASLAFVRGIHRWPANSPHKWPVTRKMFPFDDVIMNYYGTLYLWNMSRKMSTRFCCCLLFVFIVSACGTFLIRNCRSMQKHDDLHWLHNVSHKVWMMFRCAPFILYQSNIPADSFTKSTTGYKTCACLFLTMYWNQVKPGRPVRSVSKRRDI